MAELYQGRVIRITFGEADADDIRVLEALLEENEEISGFVVDRATHSLLAFAEEESVEDSIFRALLTSGLYPVSSREPSSMDGHGHLAS